MKNNKNQFTTIDTICMVGAMNQLNFNMHIFDNDNNMYTHYEFGDLFDDDYRNDKSGKYSIYFDYSVYEHAHYDSKTKITKCTISLEHLLILVKLYGYRFDSFEHFNKVIDNNHVFDSYSVMYVDFEVYGNKIIYDMLSAFNVDAITELFYDNIDNM